ncbi:MAG: hypothetical protein ABIM46_05250 [candidate division WOR-3 bacterium]
MNGAKSLRRGMELFRAGRTKELADYMRELEAQDPLAHKVLRLLVMAFQFRSPEVVRRGPRLFSAVAGRPDLAPFLFNALGIAYSMMGEIEASENYHLRDLEASEAIGDKDGVFRARTNLLHIRFCRGEYELLYKEIKSALKNKELPDDYYARYHLAFLEIIKGEPDKVLRIIKTLKHSEDKRFYYFGSIEIKGLALRLMGRLEEAMACYEESAEGMVRLGAAYSAFPCAKALELSRLAGLPKPPRRLISACLSLGVKGSWGEQAAAQAIQALNNPDNEKCCSMLFEAAGGYKRAYHLLEAFTSGLLSAQIAWQIESPLFAKILRFLAPLAPAHPGFRKDPLLGRFLTEIYPLLTSGSGRGNEHSIRAYLIGEMRVLVDGKEIPIGSWRRKKAARALVYLLLSPKHRLPQDHLFYLLWPRRKYDERSREGLYSVIYTIRKGIGRPELLTKRRDFYQLEDVWTDLDELELLIRKADAAQDTDDRVENLSLARSIAKDELLPEIIDDHYIEEYREYYNRLRRRIFSSSG